jgi:hypothetical protein
MGIKNSRAKKTTDLIFLRIYLFLFLLLKNENR